MLSSACYLVYLPPRTVLHLRKLYCAYCPSIFPPRWNLVKINAKGNLEKKEEHPKSKSCKRSIHEGGQMNLLTYLPSLIGTSGCFWARTGNNYLLPSCPKSVTSSQLPANPTSLKAGVPSSISGFVNFGAILVANKFSWVKKLGTHG